MVPCGPSTLQIALVSVREDQTKNSDTNAQSIQFEVEGLEALTPTMTRVAVSRPVVEDIIRQLDLQTTPKALTRRLAAEPVTAT
jgi:capsular polysaccharide biosynthesis protein